MVDQRQKPQVVPGPECDECDAGGVRCCLAGGAGGEGGWQEGFGVPRGICDESCECVGQEGEQDGDADDTDAHADAAAADIGKYCSGSALRMTGRSTWWMGWPGR